MRFEPETVLETLEQWELLEVLGWVIDRAVNPKNDDTSASAPEKRKRAPLPAAAASEPETVVAFARRNLAARSVFDLAPQPLDVEVESGTDEAQQMAKLKSDWAVQQQNESTGATSSEKTRRTPPPSAAATDLKTARDNAQRERAANWALAVSTSTQGVAPKPGKDATRQTARDKSTQRVAPKPEPVVATYQARLHLDRDKKRELLRAVLTTGSAVVVAASSQYEEMNLRVPHPFLHFLYMFRRLKDSGPKRSNPFALLKGLDDDFEMEMWNSRLELVWSTRAPTRPMNAASVWSVLSIASLIQHVVDLEASTGCDVLAETERMLRSVARSDDRSKFEFCDWDCLVAALRPEDANNIFDQLFTVEKHNGANERSPVLLRELDQVGDRPRKGGRDSIAPSLSNESLNRITAVASGIKGQNRFAEGLASASACLAVAASQALRVAAMQAVPSVVLAKEPSEAGAQALRSAFEQRFGAAIATICGPKDLVAWGKLIEEVFTQDKPTRYRSRAARAHEADALFGLGFSELVREHTHGFGRESPEAKTLEDLYCWAIGQPRKNKPWQFDRGFRLYQLLTHWVVARPDFAHDTFHPIHTATGALRAPPPSEKP